MLFDGWQEPIRTAAVVRARTWLAVDRAIVITLGVARLTALDD